MAVRDETGALGSLDKVACNCVTRSRAVAMVFTADEADCKSAVSIWTAERSMNGADRLLTKSHGSTSARHMDAVPYGSSSLLLRDCKDSSFL